MPTPRPAPTPTPMPPPPTGCALLPNPAKPPSPPKANIFFWSVRPTTPLLVSLGTSLAVVVCATTAKATTSNKKHNFAISLLGFNFFFIYLATSICVDVRIWNVEMPF
ncbi:hypothetical protein Hanom_Chr15g01349981 [Helianthus anomalus]